jgi:hypothetical protein
MASSGKSRRGLTRRIFREVTELAGSDEGNHKGALGLQVFLQNRIGDSQKVLEIVVNKLFHRKWRAARTGSVFLKTNSAADVSDAVMMPSYAANSSEDIKLMCTMPEGALWDSGVWQLEHLR